MAGLEPDLQQATRFLEVLDRTANDRDFIYGIADGFSFQTFDDNKSRKDRSLARVIHNTLARAVAVLTKLNAAGAGVFVTVNETDMKGRLLSNITRVRAVWIEDDGDASDMLPLMPHLICETSPGKSHSLFLVDGLTFEQQQQVQAVLVSVYGSDPQAKDLSRVLRVPGFYHCKGTPHQVKLLYASDAPPYTAQELLKAFPSSEAVFSDSGHASGMPYTAYTPPVPEEIEPGYSPITEADASPPLPDITLENAVLYLPEPGEQTYAQWRDVGLAIHHQFQGSYEALVMYDGWSQKVRNYLGFDDVAKAWASFGKRAAGPIVTFRSLVQAFNKRMAETRHAGDVSSVEKAKKLLTDCHDYMSLVRDIAPKLWRLANKNVVLENDFTLALMGRYEELRPGEKLSKANALRALKMVHHVEKGVRQTPAAPDFNNPRTPDWAKDWVWISEEEVFFDTRTRVRLTPSGFRGHFDSCLPTGDGAPSDAATWIRKNDLIPKVMRSLYVPRFGRLFDYAGVKYVNTFNDFYRAKVPEIVQNEAAVQIFQRHLELVCGGWNREAHLLANFLEACTAEPPVKVRWAPLLIGANGDGKTLFYTFMAEAMGLDNVQIVNGSSIMASASTGQTGWAEGSCFTVINEVKWQGHNRYDITNMLKPYITDDMIPIRKLYQEIRQRPNPTNYMMLSNFDDCIPIDAGDRRPFVIKSKLPLETLSTEYFDDLHAAMARHAGDIVRWLRDLPKHEDFKPNGAAPMTADKENMIRLNTDDMVEVVKDILNDGEDALFCKDVICFNPLFTRLMVQSAGSIKPDQEYKLSRILANLNYTKIGRARIQGERQNLWVRNKGGDTLSPTAAKMLLDTRWEKQERHGLGHAEGDDLV